MFGTRVGLLGSVLAAFSLATMNMAIAAELPGWPDTPLARLEALALLQTFNADLLSHPSATLTLERWCGAHHLADEAKITAKLDRAVDKPATAEQRKRLAVGPDEPLVYRRVRLICGDKVLSEADNWYVPARLTPEMNRLLTETETPFGRAVLSLDFHRELLSADLLWHPLPANWEIESGLPAPAGGALAVPDQVLQHRAVLLTRANTPFSEVVETYTGQILAFAPPAPAP
ncbi:MAG TPA: hypothetical protein VNT30_03680 [Stellaceae bacterium]|nr:hypothetical protein [Stellaceae bacterium]